MGKPASQGEFPLAILILSFLAGAGVMILEICASRLLSPYFGNSIYVWGSLIGIVLLALSLGYLLGGSFADKFPSEKVLSAIVAVSGALVFLVPVFSGEVFSFARRFGFVLGPLISASVLLIPGILFLGAVSPYALKLLGERELLGKSSGTLYALSAIGSLAGTFLTTFFFAPFAGTRETVLGLGIVLSFSGVASFFLFSGKKLLALSFLLLAAVPLAFLGSVPSFGGGHFSTPGVKIIHSEESLYQKIVVAEGPSWGNATRPMRLLILDGGFSGAVYPDSPEDTPFSYPNYFSLAYAIKPEIRSALFIGGGSFSMPRKFLAGNPSMNVDVVEIDPAVVRVSREFLNLSGNPGFGIFINDGRVFLANSEKSYDFIAIDAYSGWTVPAHMLTREFFWLASSRLSEGGLLAINLIGATEGGLAKVNEISHRTLSEVFPSTYAFPVGGPLRENQVSNVIIFASKNGSIVPSEILKKRAFALSEPLGLAKLPEYLNGYDPYWPGNSSERGVFTDNYSPVNNIRNPDLSSFFLLG